MLYYEQNFGSLATLQQSETSKVSDVALNPPMPPDIESQQKVESIGNKHRYISRDRHFIRPGL